MKFEVTVAENRRARADSISEAINAMKSSVIPRPRPPKQCRLRREDKRFWTSIIDSRAMDEWSDNDLVVAVQLARTQADIETEQEKLHTEGSVVYNAKGTQIMNPRVSVLENLARREMALMRALHMTGVASGTSKESEASRALERNARKLREAVRKEDPHGLLAV